MGQLSVFLRRLERGNEWSYRYPSVLSSAARYLATTDILAGRGADGKWAQLQRAAPFKFHPAEFKFYSKNFLNIRQITRHFRNQQPKRDVFEAELYRSIFSWENKKLSRSFLSLARCLHSRKDYALSKGSSNSYESGLKRLPPLL
ncbi:hypothetical protein PoB_001042300 [Plakobranchus ocellatus]|uniref:Uncharacterized protein n=1 Tax=Plakobranchus ocellatus TaxID=259542 RepID=A0AAV3YNS0_9GAST|nr:hypothetical protein PoB_001042300 [Plakobranchus ocellatus]